MSTKRVAVAGVLTSSLLLVGCGEKPGDTSGRNEPQIGTSAVRLSAGDSQWNAFGAASTEAGPSQTAVNKTDAVVLDVNFAGYTSRLLKDSHGEFVELSVPECGVDGEVGDPALPFKGYFVEVPVGVVPSLQILEDSTAIEQISGTVVPKQPPAIDSVDTPPPFTLNKETYARDAWVPAEPAEIARVGFMRGHHLVFIKVHPLQYNPAKSELRVHKSLRLQISFSPSVDLESERGADKISNPEFESMAERLIVNYRAPTFSHPIGLLATEAIGADYLIIVDDPLKAAVDPLAAWKTQKGYSVKVVKKSEIGTTPDSIRTYVQTAFNTWQPAPSYLLLVGDQGNLPSYPVTPDAYGSSFISDLPYSLLQGTDYWPDIAVGRLSCDSLSSCNTVVGKILKYDQNPDTGNWYNSSLVAAFFQDYNDYNCVEDRWFFETGANVYQHMKNNVGHTMLTSFVSDSTCTTYTYRSDSYPHRLPHPASVPSDLASMFLSGAAATAAVTSAFQGGVGLVQHRDHGAETGWGDPSYWVSNVNTLTNGDKTPIVFSINCLTGAFDYSGGDCFCEALQKRPGGGAVGVVGATRVSYSGYNDLLTNGMFTGMWPSYDGSHASTQYPRSFRPAQALNFGKHYMYTYEGDNSYTMYQFRLFHWFGDPEMEYRFHTPQALTNLNYPSSLPPGTQSITVSGAPDGALVGLSQAGVALGRAFSQSGTAVVPVSGTIQPGSAVTLTVTHHSAIPYVATLQSVGPAGIVSFNQDLYDCEGTVQVALADSDLSGLGQYQLNVNSTTAPQGVIVTLTESPANTGVFAGALTLGATGLAVTHGDQITVTYEDQNTGSGGGATVHDTATISCLPPTISNVQIQNVTAAGAQVCFATNVPTTGAVVWGVAKPPTQTADDPTSGTNHCIQLSGLTSCTSYNVEVRATDELGHVGIDNKSGAYYTFTTKGTTEVVALWAPLDTDPGWTKTGDWEFGPPQGKGSYSSGRDPTSAYSGLNVYGNDLSVDGDYPNSAVNYFLTTTPFSLANLQAPITLSFYRWLNIESSNWDHARVQVWNGSTWDTIWDFVGSTTLTSTWTKVEYNLGAYAGHSDVRIRWTLDTDYSVVYGGWNIDDIKVVATDPSATCGNTPPTAEAGADQSVVAGAEVTLDGSGSFDPDGDPLTFTWSQIAGPEVQLSDAHAASPTFTAPVVSATTTLTFLVTVSDGQAQTSDSVNIIVTPIPQYSLTTSATNGTISLNPAGGTYNAGTVVTLTAAPAAGYVFSGWSGDLTGTTNPATLTMNSNKSVTANFTAPSSTWASDLPWTQVSNGWGPVEKDKSNGERAAGDGRTITLNGVRYSKGFGCHAVSEISIPLNRAYSSFTSDIGVDDEVGSNGTVVFQVVVDGVTRYTSPTMRGSSATQTVTVDVTGATTLRLRIANGGDNINSDHADWAGAKLISGPPVPTYTLTTSATNGTISVNPPGGTYSSGTVVTLTATPAAGYVFSGWSGSLTGTTNPATLTMNANKSVTATFTAVSQYTLTTSATNGTISLNPPGGTYSSGTVVTLTATPAAGYAFSGWSGSLTGTTNPATLTMNANKSVTASFTAVPTYTLTTSATNGTISLNPPGGTYSSGTVVTLTATPAAGYVFSGWSGSLTGTTNPATLTMNANKSVTATFTASAAPITFEAENLARTASSVGSNTSSDSRASGGVYVQLAGTPGVGAYIEFTIPNLAAATYDVKMYYKSNNNRSINQASIDGVNQGATCDEYASSAAFKVPCNLGSRSLGAGNHKIRFTVTGKRAASSGYTMTIDSIVLTAIGGP